MNASRTVLAEAARRFDRLGPEFHELAAYCRTRDARDNGATVNLLGKAMTLPDAALREVARDWTV